MHDMITNTALTNVREKGKHPEHALEVFQTMQQHRLTPSIITCNALTSACEKGKQPERAWEVSKAIQQQGLMHDMITYNVLISAWEKGKPFWLQRAHRVSA
jgi:pentatricopeptide repeat domain-containing protein 1